MKTHRLLPIAATAALACMAANAPAQDKTPTANDSNTPLHLLKPAYRTGYGVADAAEVKRVIDRVLGYISQNTPAYVVDSCTGKPVDDLDKIDSHSRLAQGAFRLTSYEWGVTYSAVQAAYHATGDKAYRDYAYDRMGLLAKAAPRFKAAAKGGAVADRLMRRVLTPGSLDDCGAICSAMIKARLDGADLPLDSLIANYFNFIANKEHRLADGTFARLRPYRNSVWLDDMFMGIPAVASAVNESGQVEGVCVGTGMGFDPSFYYYRPVNVFAAHGYGPVIWAGAEMISLLKGQHPYSNDSAVLFYRTKQNTSAPIFGEK